MSLRALQQYEKGLHKDCDCSDDIPGADAHLYD